MNCIMKRKTRLAGLFLIGFALSLAGIGEGTVTLDAPAGIVAGIVLGGLGPAPLAAQNPGPNCKICQDDWFEETEEISGGWAHRFPSTGEGAYLDC